MSRTGIQAKLAVVLAVVVGAVLLAADVAVPLAGLAAALTYPLALLVFGDGERSDDAGGSDSEPAGTDTAAPADDVVGASAEDADDELAYGVGTNICESCGRVISGQRQRCEDCEEHAPEEQEPEPVRSVGSWRK